MPRTLRTSETTPRLSSTQPSLSVRSSWPSTSWATPSPTCSRPEGANVGDPIVRPATEEEIAADWVEFTGGPPVVGLLREYNPAEVRGLSWRDPATGRSGVV